MYDNIEIGIKKLTDWDEAYDSALCTVHKKAIKGKEITSKWKKDLTKARHSPLRDVMFSLKITSIPRFLADELVRHGIGTNWKMGTWREDRISKPRSEQKMDDRTNLKCNLNAEAFINISERRLCIGCASPHIVKLWQRVIFTLSVTEPELAFYCVPNCICRNGCPETWAKCNHFNNFKKYVLGNAHDDERAFQILSDIDQRYEVYHVWREGGMK